MRFDEIAEALPGQVTKTGRLLAKVGLGGKAASAEKAMRKQAAQAYKLWLGVVPKMQAAGNNMNDITTYSGFFGKWMAQNLRTNVQDPIIKKGMTDMISLGPNMSGKDIQSLIVKMMGQHREKALTAATKKQSAPRTRTTGTQNKTVDAGNLGKWAWDGKQWVNDAGAPAGGNLIPQLDQLATQQGVTK